MFRRSSDSEDSGGYNGCVKIFTNIRVVVPLGLVSLFRPCWGPAQATSFISVGCIVMSRASSDGFWPLQSGVSSCLGCPIQSGFLLGMTSKSLH